MLIGRSKRREAKGALKDVMDPRLPVSALGWKLNPKGFKALQEGKGREGGKD